MQSWQIGLLHPTSYSTSFSICCVVYMFRTHQWNPNYPSQVSIYTCSVESWWPLSEPYTSGCLGDRLVYCFVSSVQYKSCRTCEYMATTEAHDPQNLHKLQSISCSVLNRQFFTFLFCCACLYCTLLVSNLL